MRRALCLLGIAAWAASAATGATLDFPGLQALLQDQRIESVDQLIAALPAAERSHYALMFASRSLQGASYEHPRAILFGTDARFIVTFNGSPDQRGFTAVETMELDDRAGEFRLREVQFAEPMAGGTPVTVSEPNPPRCARCHGTPPHPVWDTLPLWPGAYGERYRASLSAQERSGLAAFLAQQANHPRYRHLLGTQRLADPRTFRPGAVSEYGGLAAEPPNAELAVALGRLQSLAIVRHLARQPAFPAYQFALLGATEHACGVLADFYPPALWRTQRPAFERFVAETAAANARQARFKQARAGTGAAAAAEPASSDDAWVPLRFVAETALGISTRSWTLALERGTYDFTFPPLSARPLRDSLIAEVAARDPTVRALSFSSSGSGGDRYCSYLQRRSVAALSVARATEQPGVSTTEATTGAVAPTALPAAGPAAPLHPAAGAVTAAAIPTPPELVRPAALRLCVDCHEGGAAPPVPFSDPTQLAQQLRARSAAHGTLIDEILFRLSSGAGPQRMPLGINLPDTEQLDLVNYFTTLAASSN